MMRFALLKEQQHSQNRNFRGHGAAVAPPFFKAGWSGWVHFVLFLCPFNFLIWNS
jgi:hypothetical protein